VNATYRDLPGALVTLLDELNEFQRAAQALGECRDENHIGGSRYDCVPEEQDFDAALEALAKAFRAAVKAAQ